MKIFFARALIKCEHFLSPVNQFCNYSKFGWGFFLSLSLSLQSHDNREYGGVQFSALGLIKCFVVVAVEKIKVHPRHYKFVDLDP